ncbi:hypothetical protein BKA70DRAFT_1562852 [Coprinopsis sp. MPI-PUGE-AT-0042]|nr:hypothetical protein BKA70DRAFT_1562852 [Coprinopsis sp. MPI-PUGE-AT-0042]
MDVLRPLATSPFAYPSPFVRPMNGLLMLANSLKSGIEFEFDSSSQHKPDTGQLKSSERLAFRLRFWHLNKSIDTTRLCLQALQPRSRRSRTWIAGGLRGGDEEDDEREEGFMRITRTCIRSRRLLIMKSERHPSPFRELVQQRRAPAQRIPACPNPDFESVLLSEGDKLCAPLGTTQHTNPSIFRMVLLVFDYDCHWTISISLMSNKDTGRPFPRSSTATTLVTNIDSANFSLACPLLSYGYPKKQNGTPANEPYLYQPGSNAYKLINYSISNAMVEFDIHPAAPRGFIPQLLSGVVDANDIVSDPQARAVVNHAIDLWQSQLGRRHRRWYISSSSRARTSTKEQEQEEHSHSRAPSSLGHCMSSNTSKILNTIRWRLRPRGFLSSAATW